MAYEKYEFDPGRRGTPSSPVGYRALTKAAKRRRELRRTVRKARKDALRSVRPSAGKGDDDNDSAGVQQHELRTALLNRLMHAVTCSGVNCTRVQMSFRTISTREELDELLKHLSTADPCDEELDEDAVLEKQMSTQREAVAKLKKWVESGIILILSLLLTSNLGQILRRKIKPIRMTPE